MSAPLEGFVEVPLELQEYFKEPQKKEEQLKALRKKSPWVQELEKDDSKLRPVRKVFLEDGYTFISALEEFLDAIKWREFLIAATHHSREGGVLVSLLAYASRSVPASRVSGIPKRLDPFMIEACGSNAEFLEMISQSHAKALESDTLESIQPARQASNSISESRWLTSSSTMILPKEEVASEIAKSMHMQLASARDGVEELRPILRRLGQVHAEEMTFNVSGNMFQDYDSDTVEPRLLRTWGIWQRIGRNLRSLGRLVGAKLSQADAYTPNQGPPVPEPIIKALREVISNEGKLANVMLDRLEERHDKIRRQQQAITALQFRHLLEQLPKGLRGSFVDEQEWDRMTEKQRWCEFWKQAVRQVYSVYQNPSSQKNPSCGPFGI